VAVSDAAWAAVRASIWVDVRSATALGDKVEIWVVVSPEI
jgi:hypothetical protein